MSHFGVAEKRISCAAILVAAFLFSSASMVRAQDEAGLPDTTTTEGSYASIPTFAGQFTPGSGFDIIKTERGSINLSVYGLFRYLNQMPGDQTFTDHLGRERKVAARNDINWHRTMLWVSGFFYNPNFRYTITAWSLASTEQTLVFGLLRYTVS